VKKKERKDFKETNSLWNLMDTSIKSDKMNRNQNSFGYNCISVSHNTSTIDGKHIHINFLLKIFKIIPLITF
jgi:hypothetical protein